MSSVVWEAADRLNVLLKTPDEVSSDSDKMDQDPVDEPVLASTVKVISEVLIIYMFAFDYLEKSFNLPEHSSQRLRIRTLQSLCLTFILEISRFLASSLCEISDVGALIYSQQQEYSTLLLKLCPLSLCAIWFGINVAPLKLYVMWGDRTNSQSRNFEGTRPAVNFTHAPVKLLACMREMARFLTNISPFVIEMSGIVQLL